MRLSPVLLAVLLASGGCDADAPLAPDAPPEEDLGLDLAAIPPGCTTERSEVDRPDDGRYDQIRVIYVTPSDGPDLGHDTSGKICNSVRALASWFHARTGQYLRFDTTGGLLDIGFARLARTDAEMRGTDPGNGSVDQGIAYVLNRIEREVRPLAPNKLYAFYYEGTSTWACGGGAWPPAVPGRAGAMYLRAMPPGQTVPCGDSYPWGRDDGVPSYVDYGMLHELVHSLGLVRDASPNEHASGHVFDVAAPEPARDLMYSPRAGMPDPGWAIAHPEGLLVDLGGDDYALDLAGSSLIAPLPADARRPAGW